MRKKKVKQKCWNSFGKFKFIYLLSAMEKLKRFLFVMFCIVYAVPAYFVFMLGIVIGLLLLPVVFSIWIVKGGNTLDFIWRYLECLTLIITYLPFKIIEK